MYCVYYRWIVTKNEEHVHMKKNLIFLFFDSNASVELNTSWREFAHKKSCRESERPEELNFCQNSETFIVLKLPREPYDQVSSPTQSLFSLVTAHSHALFVLY